jgi:hypothetical protein
MRDPIKSYMRQCISNCNGTHKYVIYTRVGRKVRTHDDYSATCY